MSVSVVIGTYGNRDVWEPLVKRAEASVLAQTVPPHSLIWSHHKTLAQARNSGAEQVGGDWLIFLDADDELDPGYIEAMLKVEGDIRRPNTVGIVNGIQEGEPSMIPRADIFERNFIVIGAMVERERFLRLGGFLNYEVLEDWELWLRMYVDGACIVDVPDAIYRVHINPGSRNLSKNGHKTYSLIRGKYASHRQSSREKRGGPVS